MGERRRFEAILNDWDEVPCPDCGGIFRRDELAKDASRLGGRKTLCVPCDRARARAYYAANRELVRARQRARRPVVVRLCSECGVELEPPKRVVCSPLCRERRFRRLNPEAYAAREAAKVVRRRERRRELRSALASEAEAPNAPIGERFDGCGGQSASVNQTIEVDGG